jgi:hypothetical protein
VLLVDEIGLQRVMPLQVRFSPEDALPAELWSRKRDYRVHAPRPRDRA